MTIGISVPPFIKKLASQGRNKILILPRIMIQSGVIRPKEYYYEVRLQEIIFPNNIHCYEPQFVKKISKSGKRSIISIPIELLESELIKINTYYRIFMTPLVRIKKKDK